MKIVHCEWIEPQLQHGVDNKQTASFATILHCILPFYIALCSVDLFGSVVEVDLATELDDGEVLGKSLCKR